jgi:tetratricopeptide (TPR) repeat protein
MNPGSGTEPFASLVSRAEAHAAKRELPQAIAAYEAALSRRPGDADILVQLSYVHSLSGHYRLGRDYALRAHATGTTSPKVLVELVPRLRTFNAIPELLECVERLQPLSRIPIPLLVTIAAHLSYVNLPERAIDFLDEAYRGDPDYPPTLLARAQVLVYLGRFEEARRDIDRALKRAPEIAHGYWLQAALDGIATSAGHVDAIRSQLRRPGRSPADVALLEFALHKQLDDHGDHAGAWEALMAGCRAKRSTLRYETAESEALLQALLAFEPMHVEDPQPTVDEVSATPVFIVGMHRSGTTLLEQLLDGSPQVRGIGELYDFASAIREATDHHCSGVLDATIVRRAARANLAAAGRRYLQGIAWRLHGEAFFTDKLPSNFLNIGFIARALPRAKILHMVRDPVETCFSNLRELFSNANPYSYDLQELAAFHGIYRRLMAHWHRQFPGRILDVDYARLLRDPADVMREVCEFCGIDFDPAMLGMDRRRGVVTASAIQVRGAIEVRATPKWAAYQDQLAPLIRALQGQP